MRCVMRNQFKDTNKSNDGRCDTNGYIFTVQLCKHWKKYLKKHRGLMACQSITRSLLTHSGITLTLLNASELKTVR